MRPIFVCNNAPAFTLTNRAVTSSTSKNTALISLPMLLRYSNIDIDSVPYERLFIKIKDNVSTNETTAFTSALKTVVGGSSGKVSIWDANDSAEIYEKVRSILNTIFNVIIAITMFLCFFSLTSSMTANLYE
jgi:hypothetical protein